MWDLRRVLRVTLPAGSACRGGLSPAVVGPSRLEMRREDAHMNLTTIRRTGALTGATLLSVASLTVGISTHAEAATGTFYYHPSDQSPSYRATITNPPPSQCIFLGNAAVTGATNNTDAVATLYTDTNCNNVLTQMGPGTQWSAKATSPFGAGARSVKFSG
jgi:hypothetical protein